MSLSIYDKLLIDLANRSQANDPPILRKSKELLGLLNSKYKLICPETAKVMVCLELASTLLTGSLTRETSIKFSGIKKKAYINLYNNVSKLLNLDKIYSVKEACMILGVSEMNLEASKLLEKYKTTKSSDDVSDFDHPMYVCAAIYSSCRASKVKLSLPKLIELSRIKKSELEELTTEFQKLLDLKINKVKSAKKKIIEQKNGSDVFDLSQKPKRRKADTDQKKMTDEEYNEWKRRMLEE